MPAAQTHVHALKNIILLACVSVRVYMHLQTNILMHTSPHACVRRCLVRVAAHVSHTNTHIHIHTHTHTKIFKILSFLRRYICVMIFLCGLLHFYYFVSPPVLIISVLPPNMHTLYFYTQGAMAFVAELQKHQSDVEIKALVRVRVCVSV